MGLIERLKEIYDLEHITDFGDGAYNLYAKGDVSIHLQSRRLDGLWHMYVYIKGRQERLKTSPCCPTYTEREIEAILDRYCPVRKEIALF